LKHYDKTEELNTHEERNPPSERLVVLQGLLDHYFIATYGWILRLGSAYTASTSKGG
jgi:hypothetical protein